jgi:hypothetical protein
MKRHNKDLSCWKFFKKLCDKADMISTWKIISVETVVVRPADIQAKKPDGASLT